PADDDPASADRSVYCGTGGGLGHNRRQPYRRKDQRKSVAVASCNNTDLRDPEEYPGFSVYTARSGRAGTDILKNKILNNGGKSDDQQTCGKNQKDRRANRGRSGSDAQLYPEACTGQGVCGVRRDTGRRGGSNLAVQ